MIPTELGALKHAATHYGMTSEGLPLNVYLPQNLEPKILIMASIHGDESISTVLLSECLRRLDLNALRSAVILSANPEGVLTGTRCNGRGVDLNRNFPTSNWKPDPVTYRNKPHEPQNISLSPGASPGSEPETQALINLLEKIKPRLIVSIHGFLDCIDDPDGTAIAQDMAQRSGMPLVPDVGYATPGSFGSWCAERDIPIITYELPSAGMVALREVHHPIFCDVMTGSYDKLID